MIVVWCYIFSLQVVREHFFSLQKQTINYSKFKVDELKKMCQDKELENYRSLKKAQLVALLENS